MEYENRGAWEAPCMRPLGGLADLLYATAKVTVEGMRGLPRKAKKPSRKGHTLQPGDDTPLWNELVKLAIPLLKKRGEKAKLGRLLRVPRQRISDYLRGKNGCPDAERTLLLLCWVSHRLDKKDFSPECILRPQ